MGGPDLNKHQRVKYKNRVQTLKSKAHELSYKCGAKVYLVIDHKHESFVYNSVDDATWPPADSLLEAQYPHLERRGFSEMQQEIRRKKRREIGREMPKEIPKEMQRVQRERQKGMEKPLSGLHDPDRSMQWLDARWEHLRSLEELHEAMKLSFNASG